MRYTSLVLLLLLAGPTAPAGAVNTRTYETHDADASNDLPCYRLTLARMIHTEEGIEMDAAYRGSSFILRSKAPDDCTVFVGEAAYDDDHSFFIEVVLDENCQVPKRFVAELHARHDSQGESFGSASCKKLRRARTPPRSPRRVADPSAF